MDVDSVSGKMVVAGRCSDVAMCGANVPNPLIELIHETSLEHLWSVYIPLSSSINLERFYQVRFRPDGLQIAAMLEMNSDGNQELMLMLFDTITGSLLRSIQHDSWDDGDIYSQSMVFDQSNYIAASLTINNDWYMFRLLLANVPSDVTTDWVISTSGVNDKYNWAKGYSIIFDRINSPTGYFTSG
jgi:hypothetical protein